MSALRISQVEFLGYGLYKGLRGHLTLELFHK